MSRRVMVISATEIEGFLGVGGYAKQLVEQDDAEVLFASLMHGDFLSKVGMMPAVDMKHGTMVENAQEAAKVLGAKYKSLQLIYRRNSEDLPISRLAGHLEYTIREFKPVEVFFPRMTANRVHSVLYQAMMAAIPSLTQVPMFWTYETPRPAGDYVTHSETGTCYVGLTEPQVAAKAQALESFEAYLSLPGNETLFDDVIRLGVTRGREAGVSKAERFWLIRELYRCR